jgi:hypothetical protein
MVLTCARAFMMWEFFIRKLSTGVSTILWITDLTNVFYFQGLTIRFGKQSTSLCCHYGMGTPPVAEDTFCFRKMPPVRSSKLASRGCCKGPEMLHHMRMMIGLGKEPAALRKVIGHRRRMCRGHEQADPWPVRLHVMAQRDAIHLATHPDISEKHVNVGGAGGENVQGLGGVPRLQDLESLFYQLVNDLHQDQRLGPQDTIPVWPPVSVPVRNPVHCLGRVNGIGWVH